MKKPSNEALYGVADDGYSTFTPPAPEPTPLPETKTPEGPSA
jgi:hypothetical protein